MRLPELAAARRTHKEFGAEPVDRDTLLQLLARLEATAAKPPSPGGLDGSPAATLGPVSRPTIT